MHEGTDHEPGDERDAIRCRIHAFTSLIAVLGAALNEAAPLQPLHQARDARRAGAGQLPDITLDRAGVLGEIAQHEGLRVAELALTDPVLAGLHLSPADPADDSEAGVELGLGLEPGLLRSWSPGPVFTPGPNLTR